jgi:hypothetical protein
MPRWLNRGCPEGDENMISQGKITMLRAASIVLSFAMVASLGLAAPAHASICQGKSLTLDETVDVLKAAPTCDASMKLFQDCSYGASGDVSLGRAVREKCEADFLSKLSAPQKQIYQRGQQACLRKYVHESGTMYVSWSAFCGAELAQRYSQRALKHR